MEFHDLGDHCHMPECKQLDFLPIKCTFCELVFCKLHNLPHDHECQKVPATSKPSESVEFTVGCQMNDCKERELVEVSCPKCYKNFCFRHRHPPDHSCPSLLEPSVDPAEVAARNKVQSIANSLPAKKSRGGHKDPKLSAKVQLMKLKMKAVQCSGSVIPEDRCYFRVLLPLSHKTSSIAVCISGKWTIGRAIDAVADAAKVPNHNNQAGEELLQFFRHHDGSLIPASSVVSSLIESAQLCNGETIVLEKSAKGNSVLENIDQYIIP